MELKVLGTVAPYPKGNMNCSSFLISEGSSKVLLDAGFGASRELDILNDLKNLTIIISHFHPDHYGDLLAIANQTFIAKKLGYLEKEVDVYLPAPKKYSNLDSGEWMVPAIFPSDPRAYDFLTKSDDVNYFRFHTYNEKTELNINGDLEITFRETIHPIKTYSAKVESKDGISIVYSSDTGYKKNKLTEFSKKANILLCEATYLMGQEKGEDMHLYAIEAGKIACDADVENLRLFHTFPEIDKQKYVDEAKQVFDNTDFLKEGDILKLRKERY